MAASRSGEYGRRIRIRTAGREDVPAVLEAWSSSRSAALSATRHRPRAGGGGPRAARRTLGQRINTLVAEIDEGVGELWAAMGYRTDPRVARYFYDC